jgi:dienelactone hydrolase
MYKPQGQGPFPAIVALHGFGGILDYQNDWLKNLKDAGFVTLMVDSYCARGYYCQGQSRSRLTPLMLNPMMVSPATRATDALGALRYLQSQPFVDPERIGVLGWSGGGTAAVMVSSRTGGFKAAVGFYPSVSERQHEPITPTLILAGELDPNAAQYKSYADAARKKNLPVEVVVYPGAYRKFDEPGGMINIAGTKQEYNEAAALDAEKRVKSFFSKHLKLPR